MNELFSLFAAFFRIGLFTFGGGLTMLPMLKYELIDKRKWIDEDRLLECYAIGQCTPGIIAVNTATYVGYLRKGVAGGIFATLGMVTPSLAIISLLAAFMQSFMNNAILQHALMGIRGAVCALMFNTVFTLAKRSLVSPFAVVICLIVFLLAFFSEFPTVLLVVLSGLAGVIYDRLKGGKKHG